MPLKSSSQVMLVVGLVLTISVPLLYLFASPSTVTDIPSYAHLDQQELARQEAELARQAAELKRQEAELQRQEADVRREEILKALERDGTVKSALEEEKQNIQESKQKLEAESKKLEEDVKKLEEEKKKFEEEKKQQAAAAAAIPEDPTIIKHKVGIPKIVHYTQREKVDMPTWLQQNPGLDLRFYDNQAMDKFFSDHIHLFHRVNINQISSLSRIEKADVFRYLVVYVLGGIYADSDVSCLVPIDRWFERIGLPEAKMDQLDFLIGLEFEFPVPDWRVHAFLGHTRLPFQINQYTFGGCQGSLLLRAVLDEVEDAILRISNEAVRANRWLVLDRTGPFAFSKAIFQVLHGPGDISEYPAILQPMDQLNSRGQILDLKIKGTDIKGVLLRKWAFASNEGAPILTDHHFAGSWKHGPLNP